MQCPGDEVEALRKVFVTTMMPRPGDGKDGHDGVDGAAGKL